MTKTSATEQANARKHRAIARARRNEQIAADIPRPLEVDDAAIKRRNDLARELLSYYEYLTTLHLAVDCIKRPPKGGWPSITAERLAFLGKTDAVIDLLKHIPYISQDVENGLQIYEKCVCTDYTGTGFEGQAIKHQSKLGVDPLPEMLEDSDFIWDRLNAMEHIATLAHSASRDGHHIMVDTRDGQLALIEFMDGRSSVDDTPKRLYDGLKECFRTLAIFPTQPSDVQMADNQPYTKAQIEDVKDVFKRHGWPTANFQKETCMAEVLQLWDSY